MRLQRRLPSALCLLSYIGIVASQSTETYWSDYPLCSEICHQENFAASGCPLTNACLCENVSWLEAVARCIALNCPASQLADSATICQNGCDNSDTPMAISPEQFIQAGEAAVTSSTPDTLNPATETVTVTPATLHLTSVPASSTAILTSSVQAQPSTTPATSAPTSPVQSVTTTAISVQPSPTVQPNNVPCSDPSWAATPENWNDTGVDQSLAEWWNNNITSEQKSSSTFVGLLFNISGNGAQQCGIGADSTCALPSCPDFETTGLPKWVYFAQVSVVEMSKLFNNMDEGMTAAESQMDPVIPDMASLFPWQNPNTQLNSDIPWIEGAVSTVLSFIPFLGPIFGAGEKGIQIASAVGQSASSFANGGVQQLQSDPDAQVLGNIHGLGLQVESDFKTARDTLDSWSTSLFNGDTDSSGNTILTYMSAGRFTVNYNVPPPDSVLMAEFYFQILVSKFANDQYRNNSKTFVMCTNSTTIPCQQDSLYISTNPNRACCLYSLDNNNNYIEPPGLSSLSNSTYSIPPPNITLSSLSSYLAAGFSYSSAQFYKALDASTTLSPSEQAFSQGASFEGVWTQPVCDVPAEYGNWVANYTAHLLPCCCGVNCVETRSFMVASGIKSKGVDQICSSQFPGYVDNGAVGRGRAGWGCWVGVAVVMVWVGTI
jgi:hypothetical protein